MPRKKVDLVCEHCLKEYKGRKSSQRFCSQRCKALVCSNTPEHKAMASAIGKLTGGVAFKRYSMTDKAREQRRQIMIKVNKSEKQRRIVSDRMKLQCVNQEVKDSRFKKGHYESIKAGKIWHDSGLELAIYKMLDQHEDVQSFRRSGFAISYEFEGESKLYIPDLVVNEHYLVEIKPGKFLDRPRNIAKFAAGRKYCLSHGMTYVILTYKDCFHTDVAFKRHPSPANNAVSWSEGNGPPR